MNKSKVFTRIIPEEKVWSKWDGLRDWDSEEEEEETTDELRERALEWLNEKNYKLVGVNDNDPDRIIVYYIEEPQKVNRKSKQEK